jgi:archaeal type IV pilus assembly protein PilA
MVFMKNEVAVSPVMGTILMVAITVILAAIIATYVLGLPSDVTKTKVVAATAQLDNSGIILVNYQGGQDTDSVTSLNITAPNSSVWYTSGADGALTLSTSPGTLVKPEVGSIMKLHPGPGWPTGAKHVVVIAAFSDGPNQIILDTMV